MKDTLDFSKPVVGDPGMSVEDIWGDGTATIQEPAVIEEAPIIEDPLEDEPITDAPIVSEPTVKLEDIEFPDGDEIQDPEVSSSNESISLVEGVRSVLFNKMKRHNINTEKHDLASMDEERLAEFEEELDEFLFESRYESLKQQVDPNLGKLWSYIENGGDPKQWKKLYEDRENIQNLDVSSETGKVKKIASYYKDVVGWDEDKITKKLDRIKNTNTIEEEFEDIEAEYSKYFDQEQERLVTEQRQKELIQKQQEYERRTVFSQKLEEKNLPKIVKDKILNVAFAQGRRSDSQIVNYLDHTISRMKENPETYIKLAHFLADPEAYDASVLQERSNKKVEDTLKKGFTQITKVTPSGEQQKETSRSSSKSPFKFDN